MIIVAVSLGTVQTRVLDKLLILTSMAGLQKLDIRQTLQSHSHISQVLHYYLLITGRER